MTFSLRRRLLVLLAGGFTLTIAVSAGLIYRATLHEAEEIFDYHMEEIAATLGPGAPPNRVIPPSRGDRLEEELGLLVRVEAPDGRLVHQTDGWPTHAPGTPGFHDVLHRGTPYRVFVDITRERTVGVAQDVTARRALAIDLAVDALLPFLVLVPLLVGAAWLVARWSLRPIDRARAQVATRTASDLADIPTEGLPDEVAPLVAEINLLFGRVQRAFHAQSVFIADAAHELRSPLAAVRVQAQSVQKAVDAPAREIAVQRLLAGLDRTTRLVEQMLALARQDASAGAPGGTQRVELRALAREVIGDVVELADAKDIDLGMTGEVDVAVDGRPDALRAMLHNLVDNAIKYTPRAGTVDISAGPGPEGVWLCVEDSGPGIAPQERQRVFDRFFRIAGSDSNGSGLGLSIVQSVAKAHGAAVVLDTSPTLRGLRVRVLFPS